MPRGPGEATNRRHWLGRCTGYRPDLRDGVKGGVGWPLMELGTWGHRDNVMTLKTWAFLTPTPLACCLAVFYMDP